MFGGIDDAVDPAEQAFAHPLVQLLDRLCGVVEGVFVLGCLPGQQPQPVRVLALKRADLRLCAAAGRQPDRWDALGGAVCLAGVVVVLLGAARPR